MRPRSVVLLSGGLDSIVSAAVAAKRSRPVLALTIDYGQRSAAMEIKAARGACHDLGVPQQTVCVPFFREFKGNPLIGAGRAPSAASLTRPRDVWVPFRNGVFIAIAAAYAEHLGARLIVTGFNREEAVDFPDNTRAFTTAINQALRHGMRRPARVVSYVQDLSKRQIVELGRAINAPMRHVYSCYRGGPRMCGRCASCLLLRKALTEAERP